MISFRATRVYVGDSEEKCPKWYTFREKVDSLVGIVSENIHVHIDLNWLQKMNDHDKERLMQTCVNMSCNHRLPVITIGNFDPRISKMLLAMQALE